MYLIYQNQALKVNSNKVEIIIEWQSAFLTGRKWKMSRCFQKGIHSLAHFFKKYTLASLRLEKVFPKYISFKVRMHYYHHLVTLVSFTAQATEFHQVTTTSWQISSI